VADFPRVHDVFCCLGTTMKDAGSPEAFRKVDFGFVSGLARAATRHRASQFLFVSAVRADPRARLFYSRVKGDVEEAVRRMPFDAVHIFRPSFLIGARANSRAAERVAVFLTPLIAWILVGRLRSFRPIRAATVARAMVQAARGAVRGVHVYEWDDMARLGAPA
jgi:uncharacterized protein YbjT (DUF2867 family)